MVRINGLQIISLELEARVQLIVPPAGSNTSLFAIMSQYF